MNARHQEQSHGVLAAVTASMLALSVTACDEKPAMGNSAENARQQMDRPITATAQTTQAAPAAGENTTDAGKADTDVTLTVKVKSALVSDPGLREFPIEVGALQGVVTLYGTVDTPQDRAKAMQVAQNVPGVQSVRSNIEIIRGS